ncbi:hypothetical protein GO755_27030 [Spirosoma sp. HMF4905]|uniref:KAP NTPase domain-containing protein n=1 Tax=Spirosoma arboris TaxID=2682092 RepID=A0A7K1SIS6_9BACT|nr:P-loop NTPase fold protein [Spirosoma arboris]MVM33721.1 hypothetical protein [Spirosoma arboris]
MTEINIDRPFEAFNNHFNSEGNQRILFSAPFGSGKTYFLGKYFESIKESARTFWLSPIKYIVSQNEDIFEYIKYDLAYQLLEQDEIKNEIKVKYEVDLYAYQYFINNPKDIFKLLFSVLEEAPIEALGLKEPISGVVGKVGKIGNSLLTTYESYQKHKKELDQHLDTIASGLQKYLESSKDIKGSIFEDDLLSQMIRKGIDRSSDGKQSILVIDDLDRLDPEHIFRILNILSVHQDFANGQNKFGFDKIILVCDYNNIQHIFTHKYGPLVDFTGYIEKFYSRDVFSFSNTQAIAMYCQSEAISSVLSEDGKKLLSEYLVYFVNNGKTLRSIIKHRFAPVVNNFVIVNGTTKDYTLVVRHNPNMRPSEEVKGYSGSEFYIESNDFEYLKIIKILIVIFGGFDTLFDSLLSYNANGANYAIRDKYSAIKVLAPLQLLIENFNNKELLTVSFHKDADYQFNQAQYILYPQTIIFNKNVFLKLKWNKDIKYDGTRSLYENNYDLVSDEPIRRNDNTTNPNALEPSMKNLLDILKNTLSFMRNQGFSDKFA